jgi:hypothetical protein
VFKVLYRNTNRIQEKGGRTSEVLHPVAPAEVPLEKLTGEMLRDATRKPDGVQAEKLFAAMSHGSARDAFDQLQYAVEDEVDVHRVVLAWRAYALIDVTGKEQAHTLLRQSVRYCVQSEQSRLASKYPESGVRAALPKLLDQHKLVGRKLGEQKADNTWIDRMADTICTGTRDQAAEAVAAALAEGIAVESVAEALSLAANQLVLRDPGRKKADGAEKPIGSIHGASVGVHASDAANAWRNIARVGNQRTTVASMIVAAYHTGGQSGGLNKQPYPVAEQLEKVETKDAAELLKQAEAAVKEKNQAQACALVHRYGELGHASRPVFDLLLRFAVSEDGALHAEKYYRTVSEEFAASRPAFRWRHLAALARVTASEYGFAAPGYAEACKLLKV